ncbi:17-beta-hydroxysteroid dehydrogenase 13-like [Physella acuta]|uniref:17-beta-hydroxysteroid dehydrogenase 13-like n=1 Tax=Physella acuta TaxID=109671 RepID=UPI0027DD615D|nr:17-beta-hydroxysteroid dehydrogenase 13-like [Physella acuta]
MSIIADLIDIVQVIFVIYYHYVLALFRVFFPPARKSIKGEIALVTGAGHGIGRELALEISKLGATVVVWDINKENNNKTAEDINKSGGKAYAYPCDVANSAKISEVAQKVRSDVGDITILVNNAGIINCGPFLELSEADIRRTMEVNLLSHFWMIKEFLPSMIKNQYGHILNVLSMAALTGAIMMTDYSASKHGAYGLFQALHAELRKDGHTNVKMTALCPLFVDTGLIKNFSIKYGKVLTPNEVALAGIDGMLRNYELVSVPCWIARFTLYMTGILPRKAGHFLYSKFAVKVESQYKKQN